MLKFFGQTKKKKIKPSELAVLYSSTLNEVITNGFVEIKDFINENNNLEQNPNISDSQIRWFKLIVFIGNINMLNSFFEEEEVKDLKDLILKQYLLIFNNDSSFSKDEVLNFNKYFKSLSSEHDDILKSMAFAIFDKYKINDFQGDLFKRKMEPNPIFLHELKHLLKHFIWNWDDYLKKFKILF